jgi:hypothetical protein
VLVLSAVVALAAGCVSVSGPSAAPTTSPTLGVTTPHPATATPSAAPSGTPSATQSAPPTATAAPTTTAGPSASSGPTPQPSGDLGFDQRDVLFYDELTDPSSGWGVGTTGGGSVAYANGELQFNTASAGAWIWSRRLVNSTHATMRIASDFMPTGDGRFGLMCASGDTQLYGVVVGTDGSWAFVSVGANGAEELLGDSAAGLITGPGVLTHMALECAGLATGSLRMSLWLPEDGLVATYEATDGPDNFDRAAAYVEAAATGFSVAIDTTIAFGSGISDGTLSPEGQALLSHVPNDWQPMCYQGLRPPYLASTAETVLTCFLGAPGKTGAEVAEYASYVNADDMNAAYQSRVDNFATGTGTTSCKDGPGEHSYNFGSGTPDVGRLLCVQQFSGIRFDWTDTRLNILSTLVDFDGSYASTFNDWIDGGPNL